MCGVSGILDSSWQGLAAIADMVAETRHRGPDNYDVAYLGRENRTSKLKGDCREGDILAFGHNRLSIIDIGPHANQPMSSACGNYWLTYNGEVYNYIELRAELVELGYSFATHSDTEVVLTAYREWGEECFARFNGMWALGIWDAVANKLVLSRDRFGIKPLYIHKADDRLVFGSEIKNILASGDVPRSLNKKAFIDFFKWSLVNHSTNTFFNSIESVKPGSYIVVDAKTFEYTEKSYWSLKEQNTNLPYSDAIREFKSLLDDAINIRFRSDVAVGACLSGGLDSSAIVGVASSENQAESFYTFNSASEDPRFDERRWCEAVNQHTGAIGRHVYPTPEGFIEEVDELVWHQEEPFTTSSIYAQWLLMKDARSIDVPVILDGQGADEILCGYRKFIIYYIKEMFEKRKFIVLFKHLFMLLIRGDRTLLNLSQGRRYLPFLFKKNYLTKEKMLTKSMVNRYSASNPFGDSKQSMFARQEDDLYKYSVPSLLRYEDRNSMAWSVESRVPFLDYRIVEFLVSLPAEYKLRGGFTKAILRDAVEGCVPKSVVQRRDKMGFVTAEETWLKGELGEDIINVLQGSSDLLREIIDVDAVLAEFSAWRQGKSSLSGNDFFKLYITEKWIRTFGLTEIA